MLSAIKNAAFGGSPYEAPSKISPPASGAGPAAVEVAHALAETPPPTKWGASAGAGAPLATQRAPLTPPHDPRAPSPASPQAAGDVSRHVSRHASDTYIPFGLDPAEYEVLPAEVKIKMLQTAAKLERAAARQAEIDASARASAQHGSKNVLNTMQLQIAAIKLHGKPHLQQPCTSTQPSQAATCHHPFEHQNHRSQQITSPAV